MKNRQLKGFGERLSNLRKGRGLTQIQLAEKLGVSPRVIVYYEQENAQPPGALLVDLARVLRVTTDQLLGVKPIKEKIDPQDRRILKHLQLIKRLPLNDQRAVFKFIDALLKSRISIAPSARQLDRSRQPLHKAAGNR